MAHREGESTSNGIMLMIGDDGIAKEYSDEFDVVIHCESAEEREKVIEIINSKQWISCSEDLPKDGKPVLIYAWNVHHVVARYAEFRTESGYKKTWVTADAWNGNTEITDRVIAWMQLTEPQERRKTQ